LSRLGLTKVDSKIGNKLHNERPILSVFTHGSYEIDNNFETDKLKNKYDTELKVPIIMISAIDIGNTIYEFDDETMKKYNKIIQKLKYSSVLNKITQQKQFELVARDLRELYKDLLEKKIKIEEETIEKFQKILKQHLNPELKPTINIAIEDEKNQIKNNKKHFKIFMNYSKFIILIKDLQQIKNYN
jgi:hypothetical protein